MKYAQFDVGGGTIGVFDESRSQYIHGVRVSEWVEIDFTPRAAEEVAEEGAKLLALANQVLP